MEHVDYVVLISRWLHIMAAIVAIGGAAYARFAVGPAMEDALEQDAKAKLRDSLRARWAMVVHTCIFVLLTTGFANFFFLAIKPQVKAMPYHALFVPKLLLAMVIFFIATALVGRAPGLAKMRESSSKWLGIVLLLAVIVIFLSGLLSQVRAG